MAAATHVSPRGMPMRGAGGAAAGGARCRRGPFVSNMSLFTYAKSVRGRIINSLYTNNKVSVIRYPYREKLIIIRGYQDKILNIQINIQIKIKS